MYRNDQEGLLSHEQHQNSSLAYLPPKVRLLPYSDKKICPKIHEDASLVAGPCYYGNLRGQPVHVTFCIVYLEATSKGFKMQASFVIVWTLLRAKAMLSDFSFGLASRSLGSCCIFFARRLPKRF